MTAVRPMGPPGLASPTAGVMRGFAKLSIRGDGGARRRLWLKLARLLNSNIPLLRALDNLHSRRVANSGASDPMAMALSEWRTIVNNGQPLSDAVADWVSDDERMLILSGEESGTLADTLLSIALVMDAKKRVRQALYGIIYPAFLGILVVAFVWYFGVKVMPQFTGLVASRGAQWQGSALVLVNVSAFVREWMLLIVAAGVATVGFVVGSLPYWTTRAGALRVFLDRSVPPWTIYRLNVGTSWMVSLAALVKSGMRTERALQQLGLRANPWLKERISATVRGLHAGQNLGDALARSGFGFPDRELIEDIGLYAEHAGLGDALDKLGRDWLEEAVDLIRSRVAVLIVIAVLAMGLTIGGVVSGVMSMQSQMARIMKATR